jgi:acyl-coenzyme A synthetase/AMP-(fatty) acid ligase
MGAEGIVAMRTPGMAESYLDDPAATARNFRDGWFLSGDLGRLLPDGRFVLHGRRDDMLNLGGIKISPVEVEDIIRLGVEGILDVAAVCLPGHDGIGALYLALVLVPGRDFKAARDAAVNILPVWMRPCYVGSLHALPRTVSGKLRRAEVRAMFQSVRASPAS